MADIRSHGYRVAGLPDVQLDKQYNNLKYVDHLAMVTDTDVSEWPIDLFKDKSGKVYLERQKINRVFFEFKAKEVKFPKEIPRVNLAAVQQLETAITTSMDYQIAQCSHRQQQAERELRSYCESLSAYERTLANETVTLQALVAAKNRKVDLTTQITEVLAAGFWSFDEKETSVLTFISKPITITYFNEREKRNNAVHMGCLKLKIRTADNSQVLRATVHKGTECGHAADNPHPHVMSGGGSICYGELSTHARFAMATMNIVDLCDIVRKVITSYNEGDAYRNIYDFRPLMVSEAGAPEEVFDDDLEEDEPADEDEPEEDRSDEDYDPNDDI